jgi:hypothetical protein
VYLDLCGACWQDRLQVSNDDDAHEALSPKQLYCWWDGIEHFGLARASLMCGALLERGVLLADLAEGAAGELDAELYCRWAIVIMFRPDCWLLCSCCHLLPRFSAVPPMPLLLRLCQCGCCSS